MVDLLEDFCISKVVKDLPNNLRRAQADTLEAAHLCRGMCVKVFIICFWRSGNVCGQLTSMNGGLLRAYRSPYMVSCCCGIFPVDESETVLTLDFASGKSLRAAALILAFPEAAPVIPSWAADQGDLLAGIRSFDAIDTQTERLEDERVVVVGGGMRAATLALAAAERGAAAVTLVSRRNLQQAAFEVDVGWQGPKLMVPFRAETDAAVRLARCRAAHGQASIHRPLWDRLAAAIGSGAIELVEGAVVERVEAAEGAAALHLGATQGLHVARPRPSPMGEAAQTGPLPPKYACAATQVWLACGASHQSQPALGRILAPLALTPDAWIGGYPRCSDASCVLPGVPVYVAGAAACVAVGPTAGTHGNRDEWLCGRE